jgi:SEC-C motif domain protein
MRKDNMVKNSKLFNQPCPCGTGKIYDICCGIFICKQQLPATPEALMRSRYTAYNLLDIDYIIKTMRQPAADQFDANIAYEWAKKAKWTGLNIIKTSQDANQGIVEFIASYTFDNKQHVLHEISQFHLDNGQWYYIDGDRPEQKKPITAKVKPRPNAQCACGSNKKYKKCCGYFNS